MPIYEYECEECHAVHEVVQKFSDPPMEKCEKCGGLVKKLISRSAFHLKGSGWYNTDYKKPSSGAGPSKTESTPAPAPNPSKPKAS